MQYSDVLIRQAQTVIGIVSQKIHSASQPHLIPESIRSQWTPESFDDRIAIARQAAPYYISAAIGDVLTAAASKLDGMTLTLAASNFIDSTGFLWCERPIMVAELERTHEGDPLQGKMAIQGLLYRVYARPVHPITGNRLDPFVWFTAITHNFYCGTGFRETLGVPLSYAKMATDQSTFFSAWFVSAMLFVSQQLLTAGYQHATRVAREQAAKARLEHDSVRVIELRRKQYQTTGEHESSPVEWSHRWLVRGHWRNQRVGEGRAEVKTVWVIPHVKGPADKPVIVKPAAIRAVVR